MPPAKRKETTRQLQERAFPMKIQRVERRTAKVLSSDAPQKEKEKAFKAQQAAGRVKRRMAKVKAKVKVAPVPKKEGLGEGIGRVWRFFTGLPGEEKKRLKKIERGVSGAAEKRKGG